MNPAGVLASFTLLALCAPASAQLARRESGPHVKKMGGVRQVQVKYGDCVIKKNYAAARDFVLTPDLGKADMSRALSKVADGHCLVAASQSAGGVQMRFPADTMRYTLADALVRRDALTADAVIGAGPILQPALDEERFKPEPGRRAKPSTLAKMAEARDRQTALVYIAQLGECVVRADPVESRQLLASAPETAEEAKAFAILRPAIARCLPAGQTLRLQKVVIRGTVAMNFYRLANAPRRAAPSAGASR